LRTSKGIPTSVCFGFLKSLLEVMEAEKPECLAIAFDLGVPTFRHEADETYKEGRPETPAEFITDLENLKQLLAAFNLQVLMVPGYEADDVIGTLAKQVSTAGGYRVKILSGDQDLFQLIDPEEGVSVLHLGNLFAQRVGGSRPQEFGPEEVKQKLGILPTQVVDYKALCGDTSDNIPGVKGIGPKTAVQLLAQYGSLEQVYASLDQIKGTIRQKLETGKEAARHSQYMAQLALNVPLEVSLEAFRLKGFDTTALVPILEELEFQSFLAKINQLQQQFGGPSLEQSGQVADPPEPGSEDLWFFSAADTEAFQAQEKTAIAPRIIDTPEKLTELVKILETCDDPTTPVAWDTETDALSPRDANLVGIGCCWGMEPDAVAYIPTGHTAGGNLDKTTVLTALRPILEDAKYPKSLQNAKFDRLVLHFQGIELAGVVFDTMLASYVLNPEGSHNLSDLSGQYLGIMAKSYSDLVKKGQTIAELDIETVANYCGMDVYAVFHLVPKLRTELEAVPALHHLLLEVEQPLESVLASMETYGIRIDQAYLKELSKALENDLQAIEQKAYAAAGDRFNLGSPKQLSELLFDKLNLDRKKSRKTKLGYSTDAATLDKLQGTHPVVDAILEYRTLAKLKSTYVDALPALVRPDTQRVHTDFNQTITSTGRLSSSNPNLQNIPIRTEFSRKIRAAFIPEPGWLLVAADYSQIELRILAHLSQEPKLVEAYRTNEDVHKLTAQLLLEKATITAQERRLAKVINFGVIYGMGAQRFAREAGVSYSQAKLFIERFYERYPGIFAYLQRMERLAIAQGYVETILGRRRYFNFDSPSLRQLRDKDIQDIQDLNLNELKVSQYDRGLLRAAANAPIQGSSADIIKIAMIRLHDMLQPYQARLLLQVHDELIFEMPPAEWEVLQPQIQSLMEDAVSLSIPLVTEVHAGQNWMKAK
jgi:DNA polymerase-1